MNTLFYTSSYDDDDPDTILDQMEDAKDDFTPQSPYAREEMTLAAKLKMDCWELQAQLHQQRQLQFEQELRAS